MTQSTDQQHTICQSTEQQYIVLKYIRASEVTTVWHYRNETIIVLRIAIYKYAPLQRVTYWYVILWLWYMCYRLVALWVAANSSNCLSIIANLIQSYKYLMEM